VADEHVNETAEIDPEVLDDIAAENFDDTSEGKGAQVAQPQYGVGPFSIREVALGGVWLVAFVVSFFSVASQQAMAQLLFGGSVWTNGLDWILTIGVPTIAVFLVVLRRFSPDGIRRVGSLGIDQFASVAFSVSAVVWLTLLWRNVAVAIESTVWIYGWVVWVEFFLMLAGVALTVLAPVLPVLGDDFVARREVIAHRAARPIRPVAARPAREPRPTAPVVDETSSVPAYNTDVHNTDAYGPDAYRTGAYGHAEYDAQADQAPAYDSEAADASSPYVAQDSWASTPAAEPEPEPVAEARQQAFWALVPEERDIVDDRAVPIFRIGPSAWALVLEDRGEVFVVRHEDGRVGYLHDVSGVTRG
jgi:hypothetical protein